MLKSVRAIGLAAAIALAMSACNSEGTTGTGGLAFEAAALIVPPPAQNVQVTATITNISSGPVDVEFGCPAVAPVFHTGSLEGPVVYDPRPTTTCAAIAVPPKTLDAGEAITIQGAAAPSPALAAGKYYVEAGIAVNGEKVSVGAGTVTF